MARVRKAAPLPERVWVMGFHTHNAVGSICHVSGGDTYHLTREDCQAEIDAMESWPGMGDRSRYRPVSFAAPGVRQE